MQAVFFDLIISLSFVLIPLGVLALIYPLVMAAVYPFYKYFGGQQSFLEWMRDI